MNMHRDYKPAASRPEKKSNPFLNGFLLGLLIGIAIAVAFTFYINGGTSAFTSKNEQGASIEPTPSAGVKDESAEPTKDRFEFYNILPGSESKVTEQEIKQLQDESKPKEGYFLQVGAFTKRADADAQKAALAIQGIQAQLSEVTSDGNTLWRVRTGPYASAEESNPARDKLNGMGIKSTLIKTSK